MKKLITLFLFSVTCSLILFGCKSITQSTIPFSEKKLKKEESTIYFYRVPADFAAALDIKVNFKDPKKEYSLLESGDAIANLRMGAFCPVKLVPGKHTFGLWHRSQNTKVNTEFEFEIKSQQYLAIKLEIDQSNNRIVKPTIDVNRAPAELANSKLDCGME
ncbi:hypothetical protein [Leptospira interrogans]|uniref:hypothetical protein n=1 Tax=Leptospira interrogans TaxID=173 RepID=UPI000303856A|nr:hypothetical protein [Leptospira interrogans]